MRLRCILMVNWEPQSKNPPESERLTNLLYFTYLYYILSCIQNLSLHCLFYVTMHIYFHFYFHDVLDVVTAQFCLYLLTLITLITHLYTRICMYTHTQAHMYD